MNISEWLRSLDLAQYDPIFRENAIDLEVLPELTEADLEKLGVVLGHRKRMLRAIAALEARLPEEPPCAPRGEGAERRQLTVMFCDLVGSTPLSARFDPEDLREIIGAYHRSVTDTVARFAGFVAKYMGDGVLIYFGYPEAHEDDAERAVRAGLAVIEAVGRLATSEPLNVRLGVASGLVVVGDLIGAGAAQERGVVGEAPNLAARLQALARPGTLLIAESSRRQIGGLFEMEDLGPQHRAGFAEPQRAWQVLGESGVVSRYRGIALGGDAARRARRGARPLAAALAAGEDWRRASDADLGRAGDRQIAPDRRAVAAHRERAAYPAALFLLAPSPGQRALSVHHPARTRRGVRARRWVRREARQAKGVARAGGTGR
jgi:class 3 adenylate cyclase